MTIDYTITLTIFDLQNIMGIWFAIGVVVGLALSSLLGDKKK